MTALRRFALAAGTVAVWAVAKHPATPPAVAAALAGFAVLLLPGLCLERLLFGTVTPQGWTAAPARCLTISVATVGAAGAAATALGGTIGTVLLAVAAFSIGCAAASVFRRPARRQAGAKPPQKAGATADFAERCARASLGALLAFAVSVAASAPNIARDRMWYLAFVTRLAGGAPIDWSEPFFGTGEIAARFAHNAWILSLSAWSALAALTPGLVFERLAPPFLCVATASAAWGFASRCLPRSAGLATLATLTAALATRFPFFSPDRYPFFARLAEDKTVALLVFAPVVMTAVLGVTGVGDKRRGGAWIFLAVALLALALSHALVMMLAGIALATLCLLGTTNDQIDTRRAAAALLLALVCAAAPARTALLARDRIVETEKPATAWIAERTDPVVRAHLRMERLRDLPTGGPIVEPGLVADPLLLVGLLGAALALFRRSTAGDVLLASMSAPFLALAFVPYLAPLFGEVVLPWMAYRALWLVPFGTLAALACERLARPPTLGTTARTLVALTLLVHGLAALPERDRRAGALADIERAADTEAMLAKIARLPPGSRIAAAPGFAELVPARAGQPILAFADRGTAVFARSRREAGERLEASALIIAMAPGSPRLRRSAAAAWDVSHVVLQGVRCGRFGREIAKAGALVLCETRPLAAERYRRFVARQAGEAADFAPVQATPGKASWHCRPKPETTANPSGERILSWRRESRWTGLPVTARCRARLEPRAAPLLVRIQAHLPRAREAIVYRAVTRGVDGHRHTTHGVLRLSGNQTGLAALPGTSAERARLRLAPSYLPYLNLRELALGE